MFTSPTGEPPAGAHIVLMAMLTIAGCAGPDTMINPAPSAAARTNSEQLACDNGIFTAVDAATIDIRKDPALVRQRAVRVDFSKLDASAPRVTLNLFEDVCLTAVRDQSAPEAPAGQVWTGTIEGVAGSSVTIVTAAHAATGNIVSPPHTYQIRVLRDDVHLVNQVDPSKYPNEKNPVR
ncbi:MAG: hypothetical protein ACRD1U_15160 [Vicinamibacterales bacterium]